MYKLKCVLGNLRSLEVATLEPDKSKGDCLIACHKGDSFRIIFSKVLQFWMLPKFYNNCVHWFQSCFDLGPFLPCGKITLESRYDHLKLVVRPPGNFPVASLATPPSTFPLPAACPSPPPPSLWQHQAASSPYPCILEKSELWSLWSKSNQV